MKVKFPNKSYKLIVTDHAKVRMANRDITKLELLITLTKGKVISRDFGKKYWVYQEFRERSDNLICASVVLEKFCLVVITVLIYWRPREDYV